MIRNADVFRAWEEKWLSNDALSLEEKFKLLEGMYQEARMLGIFPLQDPLEGLDFKIRLAKDLHVRRAA